jgi:hypothetical protein
MKLILFNDIVELLVKYFEPNNPSSSAENAMNK